MCRINYDSNQDIKQNEIPESTMRFRWEFKSSSEVQTFVGSSAEPTKKSKSLPKKLIGTHQEDHRKVQELAGSPPEHCREFVRCSPEVCRKLARRSLDLRTL